MIRKAIYRLKENGKLANINLQAVLATEGYRPCCFTHGLYKYDTKDISYSLVVDDFGVKFTNKDDIDHLLAAIKEKYPLKIDWDGTKYIGIDLE